MDGSDAETVENSTLANRIVTVFDFMADQLALGRSEKLAALLVKDTRGRGMVTEHKST